VATSTNDSGRSAHLTAMELIEMSDAQKRYRAYLDYLKSPEWASTKRRAFAKHGYRCARCEATSKLHVHHKTYKRLGRERLSDLEILCSDCHEKQHKITREVIRGREFKVKQLKDAERPRQKRRHRPATLKGQGQPGKQARSVTRRVHDANQELHELQVRNRMKREARRAS
jgi:5-methylcytosine-specific restriction endonuclease McrA